MDWKNAALDGLPPDDQEVLISVDGINHIATYITAEKGFRIKAEGKFISLNGRTVYWYPITVPYK